MSQNIYSSEPPNEVSPVEYKGISNANTPFLGRNVDFQPTGGGKEGYDIHGISEISMGSSLGPKPFGTHVFTPLSQQVWPTSQKSTSNYPSAAQSSFSIAHPNYGSHAGPTQMIAQDLLSITRQVVLQNTVEGYEDGLIEIARRTNDLEADPVVNQFSRSITFHFYSIKAASKFVETIRSSSRYFGISITYGTSDYIDAVAVDIPWGSFVDQIQVFHALSQYGEIFSTKIESFNGVNGISQRLICIFCDSRVPYSVPSTIICPSFNGGETHLPVCIIAISSAQLSSAAYLSSSVPPAPSLCSMIPTHQTHQTPFYSHDSMSKSYSSSNSSLFNSVGSSRKSDSLIGSRSDASTSTSTGLSTDYCSDGVGFSFANLNISESEFPRIFLRSNKNNSLTPSASYTNMGSSNAVPSSSSGNSSMSRETNHPVTDLRAFTGSSYTSHQMILPSAKTTSALASQNRISLGNHSIDLTSNDACLDILHKYTDEHSPLSINDTGHKLLSNSTTISSTPEASSNRAEAKQKQRPQQNTDLQKKRLAITTNRKSNNTKSFSTSPYTSTKKDTSLSVKSTSTTNALQQTRPSRQNKTQSSSMNSSTYSTHIDLAALGNGSENRTTVMVCNIPNKLEFDDFKKFVDETNKGSYDFLYLRFDFSNRCNVGYAFISFAEPKDLKLFVEQRAGMRWNSHNYNSEKVIDIKFARIQGIENLARKFRSSPVMNQEPAFRPRFYATKGNLAGKEITFS